jgi:hypothetical protein
MNSVRFAQNTQRSRCSASTSVSLAMKGDRRHDGEVGVCVGAKSADRRGTP